MMNLLQDLRVALRGLRRTPLVTAVAVITLGAGVGLVTTMFGVTDAFLLRPLPYPDADRLVRLDELNGRTITPVTPLTIEAVAASGAATRVTGYAPRRWVFQAAREAPAEPLRGAAVDSVLLPALGAEVAIGRALQAADFQASAPAVALVSHELWRTRLSGTATDLGRQIILDGAPHTVVGIMSADFPFIEQVDVWTPLPPWTADERLRSHLTVLAWLPAGTDRTAFEDRLTALSASLAAEYPGSHAERRLLAFAAVSRAQGIGALPWIFLGAAGFVLLIACANIANILLARGEARRGELAVRAALGAGRRRLLAHGLAESALLALLGGALGLILAMWGTQLIATLLPHGMPPWVQVRLDGRGLSGALAAVVLTTFAVGTLPAMAMSQVAPGGALGGQAPGATPAAGRRRLSDRLVSAQVALSFALLSGALLFLLSAHRQSRLDFGVEPEAVGFFWLSLTEAAYPEDADRRRFEATATDALASVPGTVAVATLSQYLGLVADPAADSLARRVEMLPTADGVGDVRPRVEVVSPGYFQATGISVQRGRDLADARAANAPAAVISVELATRLFGGVEPIGRTVRLRSDGPPITLVGVASDVMSLPRSGTELVPQPLLYLAREQSRAYNTRYLARAEDAAAAEALLLHWRAALAAVDPAQAVASAESWSRTVHDDRLLAVILGTALGIFAALALVLATVGIFGVLAYAVVRRSREMGIRLALGARPHEVVRLMLAGGARVTLIGVAVGAALTIVAGRLLGSLLYGVSPHDPLVLAASALVFLTVSLAAAWLPARRAGRVDPARSLRIDG